MLLHDMTADLGRAMLGRIGGAIVDELKSPLRLIGTFLLVRHVDRQSSGSRFRLLSLVHLLNCSHIHPKVVSKSHIGITFFLRTTFDKVGDA